MRVAVAVTAVLCGFVLSSCGSGSSVESDYAVFASVEALVETADVAVVGTLGESLGTELDGGGDPEEPGDRSGLVMEFFSFHVDSVVSGSAPDSIVVAWPDLDQSSVDGASPVEPGQRFLLFLRHRDPETAPGVESFDSFFVPVSGDNGVFDVEDGVATARSEGVRSLAADGDPVAAGRFEVPLDQLVAEFSSGSRG